MTHPRAVAFTNQPLLRSIPAHPLVFSHHRKHKNTLNNLTNTIYQSRPTTNTKIQITPTAISTTMTNTPTPSLPTSILLYLLLTNILYLARRSNVRGPETTIRRLFQIRTTREPNVSLPLYLLTLLAWQSFVVIFPLIELASVVLFDRVTFFYSYPNAGGVGLIAEPRGVQGLDTKLRVKEQVRLDWHRFKLNVGMMGRDGWRHPPFVMRNRVHLDIPKRGMKHWPWRRRRTIGAYDNGTSNHKGKGKGNGRK
eukprot:CAMPEP_0198275372 /NCGR_PEP_ID=MMETSP1447-20131203/64318_1 /TAXON_ID=420782 /ORGANISM="Chaetoceros dichaeta, Strain CCMP1751" /LENGTH=252 /DNA_ID=CAMNT_0043970177 /DNA_START=100 /DNA_END=858 /DNA_ORIENTATION=-